MALFKRRIFGVCILAALCAGLQGIGLAPTVFEHPQFAMVSPTSHTPKPTVLRRATTALSICGYESGQAGEYLYLIKKVLWRS